MKRNYLRTYFGLAAACVVVVMLSSAAMATAQYDFVQESTGDILATVELSGSSPWFHADVASLTFTPEGVDIFGLPTPYPAGAFTESSAQQWITDGIGGLREESGLLASAVISDLAPPPSLLVGAADTFTFDMYATDPAGLDNLSLAYFPQGSTSPAAELISALGDWRVVPTPISIDIKPGSWPNPLNLKSRGVLPAAISGSDDFDVYDIDPDTIRLSREGYDGEASPIRWNYSDVATPFDGDDYDGHELTGDGITDLSLKFKTQEVAESLDLHDLRGETIPVWITGSLWDGTTFSGDDWLRILYPGDANSDHRIDATDLQLLARNWKRSGKTWDGGDFTGDGNIDIHDLSILARNWAPGTTGGSLVPEPATLSLLAVGCVALIRRRR